MFRNFNQISRYLLRRITELESSYQSYPTNKKISRALFTIKQIKHVFPYEILQTLYYALIFPHIEYGIIAWGSASSSILRATSMLQKRAIRSINKSAYNSHTEPLFKFSNIMKIEEWIYKMDLQNNLMKNLFSLYSLPIFFLFYSFGYWMISQEYLSIVNEPCSIMSVGRTLLFILPSQYVSVEPNYRS